MKNKSLEKAVIQVFVETQTGLQPLHKIKIIDKTFILN